ncbi:MAG: hypothetical protein ACJ796_14640 [Gemmatimonadaceae bacterium]
MSGAVLGVLPTVVIELVVLIVAVMVAIVIVVDIVVVIVRLPAAFGEAAAADVRALRPCSAPRR